MADNFKERFSQAVKETETVVYSYLPEETGHQKTIFEAMNYSVKAGGKRLRPLLMREVYRLFGGNGPEIEPFMAAMEMIHTSSLIHDDLPAMDDDDLRRGRPTNHKVYGEATAILAGDGLLTAAFGVLTQAELPAERVVEAVSCLSREAGPEGMVGGQVLDMAGEGGALTRGELEQLQQLKTGALISAAAELGCIAAGGTEEQRCAVREYARCIGRAFQIQDDILDVTSTDQELGKSVGSDRANEKNTFVTVLGLERSRALVEELTGQAEQALSGFGDPGFLLCLARALAGRRS